MKKALILSIILILALSLFACSKSNHTTNDGKVSSTNNEPSKMKFEDVKLTVIAQSGALRAEKYKELAKEFKEQTGATVEVVDAPWEQLHDKIINDIVSQSGAYDVMDIDSGWDGEVANHLELLEPYLQNSSLDMSDLLPIYQTSVGTSSITNGKRYGIPLTGQSMVMLYNKALLDEWGLEVPKTWDELLDILPKIQEKGKIPFTSAGVNVQLNKLFYAAYKPQGKPLFTPDFTPAFNNAEGVKAIERVKTLFQYAPKGYLAMDNPDANALFMNGNAVIQICWPSNIIPDLDNPDKSKIVGKWGVAVPPGPGNIGPWYLGISKYSKNKEAAFAWIELVSSKDNSKKLMLGGNYSTWKSVWADEDVKKAIPQADIVRDATNASFWPTFFVHPKGIEWFINSGSLLSDAISGKITPEEALRLMEYDWNKLKAASKIPEGLIYEELSAK